MPAIEHKLNITEEEIPENIRLIAEKQGECPKTKQQQIEQFRNHILEQKNCLPHRNDDKYLEKFLRARYWKIGASYKLLCNYYKFREDNKRFYEKVRPMDLRHLGDENILTVTPYRDQLGHRILIYRFGCWRPNRVTVDDIFRATIILQELGSLEPISQIMGGVAIFDLKDLGLEHMLHLSPSVAQKMIALLVTSMPIRTAALHIVNQNWLFNAAFKIFKPFLNASMREKLYIHGSDMSSLHKHIYPEHLPKRYGGLHEDYLYTLWLDMLEQQCAESEIQKDMEQLGFIFD
ncbi:alpha-tocopherol transfer protein isoform X2 [Drosophila hydei]|nr:alpha-tocopherol transfer protein isoform X2 [Drosophila hydei]XP_023163837.2 alpha-tocopherol transfer protein isoform X2 [Drosophila hydei]XP_023163838.2 alpha-tocopherol transfer protein isoform X2 [Drosophila hydei]